VGGGAPQKAKVKKQGQSSKWEMHKGHLPLRDVEFLGSFCTMLSFAEDE